MATGGKAPDGKNSKETSAAILSTIDSREEVQTYLLKSYLHSTMDIYEHVPKSSEHLTVQDTLLKKKTKKCRGNRKLQRYTRRCQAKGMNDQAIEMLMLLRQVNKSVHQNTQETHENQKDGSFIINTVSNVMDM
ncbi:unnamed protein product [Rotaria sp. Silwood2]|nr:unnamed protein product [Rotaria sp. Silwood2]CAF2940721.1 unnamed protein product [Rotaria sp. Silwood2]CAF3038595.1 unnamed protein product [Rotaria sp. Silwood2]CAF3414881.1 unnamed protein product [Rotaria sp. Silwood2]CAF4017263.1 unnamed protein product [Rotaria sp. Silwood2]